MYFISSEPAAANIPVKMDRQPDVDNPQDPILREIMAHHQRTRYLGFWGAWTCGLLSTAANLGFFGATRSIGFQMTLFHSKALVDHANPAESSWIFPVLAMSCVVVCIAVSVIRNAWKSYLPCILYSYLALTGGGAIFFKAIQVWIKSSVFI